MSANAFPVTEMTLRDIVPALAHMLEGSPVDVDGITIAAADLHPAFDPDDAPEGSGAMLITFTDTSGRRRVAELQITTAWREDSCWHATTRTGELGEECTDCGMVTAPTHPEARCPECHVPVTDPVSLFGVHTVSCGVVMCQCEHADHERGGPGHRYLGVRAGSQRAHHVGRICDGCATDHLADYLLANDGPDPVNQMTGHYLQAPSAADLRWTCSGCSWTASDAFTSPEERGAMFASHHQER